MPKKKKTSISLPSEIVEWINKYVEKKAFSSFTHAVEFCLYIVKELDDKRMLGQVREMLKERGLLFKIFKLIEEEKKKE